MIDSSVVLKFCELKSNSSFEASTFILKADKGNLKTEISQRGDGS